MVDSRIHQPTPEQDRAMELFDQGRQTLAIKAGAGTGKTTTLAMCARTTQRTGTYLAFNRQIAGDAGRAMPPQVQARTVHSMAAAGIRNMPEYRGLLDRLGAGRMAPWKVVKHLGLGHLVITVPQPLGPAKRKVIQPTYQAGLVLRAVAQFCASADTEPTRKHFPYVEAIDPHGPDGERTFVNNRQLAKELEPALQRAWADLTSPVGQLRFEHDVYLKLAELHGLTIPGSYLLFDEAQDASPVMLSWLAKQDRPTVYVGDDQQQIYEWRGAVNALGRLPEGTPTAYLTQSWRFGPAVADVANAVLDQLGADLRLSGTPSIPTEVHTTSSGPPPRAVLCRSNGAAVNAVLSFQAKGLQPHLVGGSGEIVRFAQAAGQLQAGERTSHPELACFDSWAEVQEYVATDPGGSDLRMMVKLLDDYGPQIVIDALDGLIAEEGADVVVSTAHKAKGREWSAVRLASDFDVPEEREVAAPEWRLLYVSATRATHSLAISACGPLLDLMATEVP